MMELPTGKSCSVCVSCLTFVRSCSRVILGTEALRRIRVLLLLLLLLLLLPPAVAPVVSRLVSRLVSRQVSRLVSRVVTRLVSRLVSWLVYGVNKMQVAGMMSE